MERHNPNHRDGFLLRSVTHHTSETRSPSTTSSNFVLQWGNRKRMRCMKVQVKVKGNNSGNHTNDATGHGPIHRTTSRIDRRVVRSDLYNKGSDQPCLKLRQRPASPSHRILRNRESSIAMRERSNGVKGMSSPDRMGAQYKRGGRSHAHSDHNTNHNTGCGGGRSASSETAHDSKKGGSSPGNEAVWLPKFVIALTNKEKEEDFMAIRGSKLPQRPKKRAKFMKRTVNLVSPGAWLCDLTLERYEVREKKVTKKRPRGLKSMGNMDSDTE